MDPKTVCVIILCILLLILFAVNKYTINRSNFIMDDSFKRKAKELFNNNASFTEFRSHYNIDNVEYVDLKNKYRTTGEL